MSSSSTEREKMVKASDAQLTAGIVNKNNEPADMTQFFPSGNNTPLKQTLPKDLPKRPESPNKGA